MAASILVASRSAWGAGFGRGGDQILIDGEELGERFKGGVELDEPRWHRRLDQLRRRLAIICPPAAE